MSPTLASLRRAGALAWALFLVCLTFTITARAAAPPVNDTCAGAVTVPAAGPFPYWTPTVEVSGATTIGDPALPEACGPTNFTRSVWFKFTPASTANYTLSVGPDTATDFGGDLNNETMMAVYTASSCSGPFTILACNDDGNTLQSAVRTNLSAGITYYVVIQAGPFIAITNQPLLVQLKVSRPVVPSSDNCGGAEVIPGSGPFPYFSSTHDTTLATIADDPGDAICAWSRSVWFQFTPAVSGTYVFSTEAATATTVYDTSMGLYNNTGGCEGTFTEVTCLDDFGGSRATIVRALTANVPVYVLVWDYEEEPIPGETSVQLRVTREGPPTVVTMPATGITTTGAVLNLSLNQNNINGTRYFFEWGPTTSYGNMTPSRQLLVTASAVNLTVQRSELISGFTPGLTYHYRAVGSNSAGRVFGLDQTFIASTNRPVITEKSVEAGGNFRLQFSATEGQLYLVQGSTDLVNWTDLGPPFALGGGQFEYTHSPGSIPPFRFYKVRAR